MNEAICAQNRNQWYDHAIISLTVSQKFVNMDKFNIFFYTNYQTWLAKRGPPYSYLSVEKVK